MTIQRFQSVVLKLGNQTYVRHFLWVNYPEDPQLMGMRVYESLESGERVTAELMDMGFSYHDGLDMWVIERSES